MALLLFLPHRVTLIRVKHIFWSVYTKCIHYCANKFEFEIMAPDWAKFKFDQLTFSATNRYLCIALVQATLYFYGCHILELSEGTIDRKYKRTDHSNKIMFVSLKV